MAKENKDDDEESEEEEEFVCDVCGDSFDTEMGLRGHMNKHRDLGKAEKQKKKKRKEPERDFPIDPEQQMYDEMKETLKDEVSLAPGGSDKGADYIAHRFESNNLYKKDDLKLYNLIKNVCPKMKNDIVNDIVDAVFDVKKAYNQGAGMQRKRSHSHDVQEEGGRQSSIYSGRNTRSSNYGRRPYGRDSQEPADEEDIQKKIEEKAQELFEKKMEEKRREEKMDRLERQIANMGEKIETLAREGFKKQEEEEKDSEIKRLEQQIQKMNNRMMQMMKEDKDDTDDFEKILKFIRLTEEFRGSDDDKNVEDVLHEHGVVTRDDLEKMQKDQTIQQLSNELQEMKKYLQHANQQSGDFNSDDAKIIAQGLSQVGRKMDQGHETVKHVIQHLPQILSSGEGQQANLSDKELEQIENELDKIEQEERQTVQPPTTPNMPTKTPEVDVSERVDVEEQEPETKPPEQEDMEPEMEEQIEGGENPPHDEEPLLEKELDESEVEEE